MVNTVTRADLAEELYRNIGLSHNESSEIIEMFFEEILKCFEKGEEVKLTSFGTFKIRNKKEQSRILVLGKLYFMILKISIIIFKQRKSWIKR